MTGCGCNGSYPNDPIDFLSKIADDGFIRLPCSVEDMFWIPERYPVYSEIQRTEKTSKLLQQLFDRAAYTALVVDALLSGKNSLCLMRAVDERSVAQEWLNRSNFNMVDLTLKSVKGGGKIMLAKLASYVFIEQSD